MLFLDFSLGVVTVAFFDVLICTLLPSLLVAFPLATKLIVPVLVDLHVTDNFFVVFSPSEVTSENVWVHPLVAPLLAIVTCHEATFFIVSVAVTLFPFSIVPLLRLKLALGAA